MRPPVPDEIVLPGATLRRVRPGDEVAMSAAATASRPHLAPWMPWATEEGVTEAAMAAFITDTTLRSADGSEAVYGLFSEEEGAYLGGCGIHDRLGPGATEIGYWVRHDATRRGWATAMAAALTDLALSRDGIERVEIHCDEANVASAGVPRRLGYHLDRVEPKEITVPGESGREMIWVRREPIGPEGPQPDS